MRRTMKRATLAVMTILILLLISGCQFREEYISSQIPQGKAILDVTMYTWGINEEDSEEILFDYWLTNFGDAEAKNVKVRCKLIYANNVVVVNTLDDYGNIASTTTNMGEALTKNKTNEYSLTREYTAFCYVESCDDCDILYKRIPALIESYE